jgi:hypothetical protein
MGNKIIINADDFGLNSSVNNAIIESFYKGLINSTTLMANMPGFDEAIELAHKYNIIDKIGIHLNLSEGHPLTSAITGTSIYHDGNECGLKKFERNLFLINREKRKTIYNEFAAQIEKVKNAGIPISHIDTHHHIDDVWTITQIIMALLIKYNIPSMRILNNLNQTTKFYKSGYRRIVNSIIKMNKAHFSDFFGNRPEAFSRLRNNNLFFENKKLEIMVHPDYNKDGILIDRFRNQDIILDYPKDIKIILNV